MKYNRYPVCILDLHARSGEESAIYRFRAIHEKHEMENVRNLNINEYFHEN